ncbi:ammonium transporter [Nocardia callitridis]|uniref:DUF8020 domain-containing protein n=1 Tax=Nocardia callitridis TaxID=648753 RepID=A0ABP9KRI2_9NOCA
MQIRHLVTTSALALALVSLAVTPAHAEPAPPTIQFTTALAGSTIETSLVGGTFAVAKDGASVAVADRAGHPVLTLPLSLRLDGSERPFDYVVDHDATVLRLTPRLEPADIARAPVTPVASPQENLDAQLAVAGQLGLANVLGAFAGFVVGATFGCLVALALGCLPGAVPLAGVGSVIGTLLVGGPALVIGVIDLITTFNAPPGTTRFAR